MHTIADHHALIEAVQQDYRADAERYRRNRAAAETIPRDRGHRNRRWFRIRIAHRAPTTT